jgi:hypothetical protein
MGKPPRGERRRLPAGRPPGRIGIPGYGGDRRRCAAPAHGALGHRRGAPVDGAVAALARRGAAGVVPPVVQAVLAKAGVVAGDVRHFVLPALFRGLAAAVARALGLDSAAMRLRAGAARLTRRPGCVNVRR